MAQFGMTQYVASNGTNFATIRFINKDNCVARISLEGFEAPTRIRCNFYDTSLIPYYDPNSEGHDHFASKFVAPLAIWFINKEIIMLQHFSGGPQLEMGITFMIFL